MIGQTISHYTILEKLGEGGMGVVYKAEDTRLKRTVALKFLSPQAVGSEEDKARFVHEAQAAAALNHPHICTVHEIDQYENLPFIAMEFVEGESLKAKVESGPLPLEEAIRIAVEIAEGLQEAHSRGITHRDIKSSNIMTTSTGRAKVMDFGLAKSPERSDLTKDGTTVGTVAYMSPEQGRGEAADGRSDIWSLGVVLYEMIAGKLPFKGTHDQAVMYSILNEEAQPLTGVRSGVPMDLERIVGKCLEKEPSGRYQHLADLLVDLKKAMLHLSGVSKSTTTAQATPPRTKSIFGRVVGLVVIVAMLAAVLIVLYPRLFGPTEEPETRVQKVAVLFFENLGPPDDEYFANGITDAITARLARIGGLGVISRQSTIQYKGSTKSIQEIGTELGVAYILEGTVQRERPSDPASRVRIIPQLISVSDDIHVWAETYDEDMTEVFRVQSDIAERVARALDLTLLKTEREAIAKAPTDNFEAYEYYLRGNECLSKRYNLVFAALAVEMYEKATELDPGFAAAWAGLTQAYIWEYYTSYGEKPTRKADAKSALDKALALDPGTAEVEVAAGYYAYYGEHDYDEALEYFESANVKNTNSVEVISAIAYIKRRQGELDECAALLEKALDLNPRNFSSAVELGITYSTMRRYEEADGILDRAIFLNPEDPVANIFKIELSILKDGDIEGARESLMTASKSVKPAGLGFESQPLRLPRILSDTYFDILKGVTPEQYGVEDTTLFHLGLAEMYHQLGMEDRAREYWAFQRNHLETSRSPIFQIDIDLCLAISCVGLGLNEKALSLARNALSDDPLSEDAFLGTYRLEMAALVFVRAGAYEDAMDQLEVLLSVPSGISRAVLRIDPAWDPLRDNPRFQKMMEGGRN